ncbi:hypothetical protein LTR50_006398 [Elasticomyces elasticus]|nr:hypothetical protein LTR50_006398 [Elasticomyces elasticus]
MVQTRDNALSVREVPGKGLGVYAISDLSKGTRILAQKPTIALKAHQPLVDAWRIFQTLSPTKQRQFKTLHGAANHRKMNDLLRSCDEHGIRDRDEAAHVMDIYNTNAFETDRKGNAASAVFQKTARINHSCIPNAEATYNKRLGRQVVHVTRDVEAGDEITVSYTRPIERTAVRQRHLEDHYGFSCDCPACDDDEEFAAESAERREHMVNLNEMLEAYNDDADCAVIKTAEEAVETTEQLIDLMGEEGLFGKDVGRLHWDIGSHYEALERWKDARKHYDLALEVYILCCGADHPLVDKLDLKLAKLP